MTRRAHNRTHGLGHTLEASIFYSARRRCNNPSAFGYEYYGGRGIEFRFASVPEFLEAVGPRPSKGHSLDRIDNDGHYEVGNVRWATKHEQARNCRSNTYLTLNGRRMWIKDWAKEVNLPARVIRWRQRAGWTAEQCLTTPYPAKRGPSKGTPYSERNRALGLCVSCPHPAAPKQDGSIGRLCEGHKKKTRNRVKAAYQRKKEKMALNTLLGAIFGGVAIGTLADFGLTIATAVYGGGR